MNQVLQAQVSEQVEADRYERTEKSKSVPEWIVSTWPGWPRVGTITLSVPRIRGGSSRQSSLVVTREVNKR
ncbi:hypothetical protein P7H25_10175 [Paenibacillus larvae]|nr:hypothetical protein [Paenibacillus larvae]MDT2255934.1 hypothetical protein [Paenibacillus larvae]